jgi:TatD DNase family protein
MILVDSHTHFELLQDEAQDDQTQAIIERAELQGVGYFLNVCVKMSRFENVLRPAELYPFVFASVGLHPNDTSEEVDVGQLIELGGHPRVIAIGETGLDYFRSSGNLDWQRERFICHIQAAKTLEKPLIIHMRDASEDTLRIMREERVEDISGVMHCFTEDWNIAKQALDLGFYISFSGIVTFKNATAIQEVAKNIPLERMLIETDAPYLAPIPMRGKTNEPSYLRHTAEFIAKLRGMSVEDLAEETTGNFFTLFKGAQPVYV